MGEDRVTTSGDFLGRGLSPPGAGPGGSDPDQATLIGALAEATPLLIWLSDASGARTWFSPRWLEFRGRALSEEIGDAWFEGVHADDLPAVRRALRRAARRRGSFEVEYRLKNAGGEYCWCLERAAAVFDGERLVGFVGSCVDISDRKRAEAALQLLSNAATLNAELDYEEVPERLAELVVAEFADWCTVYVMEDQGRLRRAAARHRERERSRLLDRLAEYRPRDVLDDHIVARVVREGVPEVVGEITTADLRRMATNDEHYELLRQLEAASGVFVPLLARGRTIGALACMRDSRRSRFDAEDRDLAAELGRRAALALDNVRLFRDQQRANEALQLLADAGAQMAVSLEFDETLSNVAGVVVPRFADWCAIDIKEADGSIRHVVVAHKDPAMVELAREAQQRYPSEGQPESEAGRRFWGGEPIFIRELDEAVVRQAARDEEHLALIHKLGFKSLIAVPMTLYGRAFGSLALIRSEGSPLYDDEDFGVAVQLGRRAAMFVDNSRLYQESQRMEAQLLQANEALRLLADVGGQLGASLEFDEAVAALTRVAVPAFADACWIDVLEGEGRLRRVALEYREDRWQGLHEMPFARQSAEVVRGVIETGEPRLLGEITDEQLEAAAANIERGDVIRILQPRSLMRLPLKARGRVFGVITFILGEGDRRYGQAELALGTDIANRGALFIDNARLYTEAQRTEADLRRANEAKDEFLSMMSHELRTPLTVVNGGARILRSRGSQLEEATRAAIINDIELESDRLFRMVENLLAMAHIEFAEEVHVEPVLAQRLLERVVESFRQRRPDREVEVHVDPGLPTLAAEPTYLEQVVRNLLSNADKYSPAGTVVELRVERSGRAEATVRVLDRGVGVAPEEAERIFERFYRSERTAKLAGGSGVGLALCRRLVTAMSGRMWAAPRPDGGLEVAFTLPLYEESNQ